MFSDHAAFLRQGEMGQVDLFFVMMGLGCSSGKRISRPSERLGRDANRLAILSDTTSPLARREGVHVRCARNPHGVHGVSLLQAREEGLHRDLFSSPISFTPPSCSSVPTQTRTRSGVCWAWLVCRGCRAPSRRRWAKWAKRWAPRRRCSGARRCRRPGGGWCASRRSS